MKSKNLNTHRFITIIIALVLLLIALIGWKLYKGRSGSTPPSSSQVNSFDECVAAGNAIMESYPEQCTANGKTFTKQY